MEPSPAGELVRTVHHGPARGTDGIDRGIQIGGIQQDQRAATAHLIAEREAADLTFARRLADAS